MHSFQILGIGINWRNFFKKKRLKHFQKNKKCATIGVNALEEKQLTFEYDKFDIERPFDFSAHSSMGCGGMAKLAVYPKTEKELVELFDEIGETGVLIVGNLSNTIASDLGTDKTVVCTKGLRQIVISEATVYTQAGVMSAVLLSKLRDEGLRGAEFLTGIPCTIGGALYMNAGAGGRYISEIVQSVRIYRRGQVIDLPNEACGYTYKHSVFMETNDVIIGATLKLEQSDRASIIKQEKLWQLRRRRLPKGKSAGCIFKNPPKYSAGELIEKAGLKGLRIGGAKVSEEHANFIINDGKATTREIRALIELIKNAVFAYCGIVLEEEIQYID